MAYNPQDPYFKKAKAENYLARSVYKLKEINDKYPILAPGAKVLDLGASPGSWSQYTSELIGSKGRLLALDLTPITLQLPNTLFVEADIFTADIPALLAQAGIEGPLDVVLSDMAPGTTGIRITDQARSMELCEMALGVALRHLKPGGSFVCKLFDGPDFQTFRAELTAHFRSVKILRPQSTRKESKELFFIAQGYKGSSAG